jgi:hypothetical protein
MTEKEKIIVSAYTGYLMTDFSKVHEYIEKKLDRPVWTHEMAFKSVQEEINEKCKDDFLDLCKKNDNNDKAPTIDAVLVVRCKNCKHWEPTDGIVGICKEQVIMHEYDGGVFHLYPEHEDNYYCAYGEEKDE